MRAAAEGRIGLTENFVLHMDRCLGCRACETACPAGVPFGRLIEETRGQIERKVPRPLGRRLLGRLAPRRVPRAAAARAAARPDAALSALGAPAPRARIRAPRTLPARRGDGAPPPGAPGQPGEPPPGRDPAAERRPRGTVALLEGCVQALLFPEVNRATVSLLARAGYRVVVPDGQGCCGALHLHWGDRARRAGAGPAERWPPSPDADWIVDERGGLRRGAPRLRAPPRGRPAGGRPGRAGAGRHRAPGRAPAGPEAAARPHGDLPRALPPRARPARAGGAAGHPAGDPGAPARRARRVRPLLRLRRRLQPDGARDRGTAPRPEARPDRGHRAPAWSRAGTRGASSSSAGGSPTAASRSAPTIRSSSWPGRSREPRPRRGAEAWTEPPRTPPELEQPFKSSLRDLAARTWHGIAAVEVGQGRWPKKRSATSRSARSRP